MLYLDRKCWREQNGTKRMKIGEIVREKERKQKRGSDDNK